MGNTSIEWTGVTWNPWQGCRRKSEGCRFCYMFRDKARYGQDPTDIHRSSDATVRVPLKWQREAGRGVRCGQDRFVFTCSWSDWFIEEADAWRDEGWAVIRQCPGLIFQILTKRPERMAGHLPAFWGEIRDRCWLGVSAEDQRNYDARRPYVDADLAPVMWWSVEPLIGPIDVGFHQYTYRPSWVVTGGESGPHARPMHPDWVRSVRDQCVAAGVPFHFKQHGEWVDPDQMNGAADGLPLAYVSRSGRVTPAISPYESGCPCDHAPGEVGMVRAGKKAAGRVLDGRVWDEFPEAPGCCRAAAPGEGEATS